MKICEQHFLANQKQNITIFMNIKRKALNHISGKIKIDKPVRSSRFLRIHHHEDEIVSEIIHKNIFDQLIHNRNANDEI